MAAGLVLAIVFVSSPSLPLVIGHEASALPSDAGTVDGTGLFHHAPDVLGLASSPRTPPTPTVDSTLVLSNDSLVGGNWVPNNGIHPEWLVWDSGQDVYAIADTESSNVTIVSATTSSILAQVSVGSHPYGLAYDSAKGEIFVADQFSAQESVISDTTYKVVATISVPLDPSGGAYDPTHGEVWVCDNGQNEVSAISDATDTVVTTIPVGSSPVRLALDSADNKLFVTNIESNNVSIISTSSDRVIANVAVGSLPGDLAYDSGKGEVFVSNGGSSNLSVISTSTDSVVATISDPFHSVDLASDASMNEVFVSQAAGNVSALSDATDRFIGGSPGINGAQGLAVDTTDQQVAVGSVTDDNLTILAEATLKSSSSVDVGYAPLPIIYDSTQAETFMGEWDRDAVELIPDTTHRVAATVPVGGAPLALCYDPGKGEVFVGMGYSSNDLVVLSDTTDAIVGSATLPGGVNALVYDPSTSEIFAAESGVDQVQVISDSSLAVVATIHVGAGPDALVFDSAQGEIFVVNADSQNLSVISDSTDQVVANPGVGGEPAGVAYDAAKGEVFVSNSGGYGNVTVLSDVTDRSVANISVGRGPLGVVVDPASGQVYIADSYAIWGGYPGYVSVLSDTTNALLATLRVGTTPELATYDPATAMVEVANFDSGTISLLDDGTGPSRPTLSSVAVAPASTSAGTGGTVSLTATPTCTGGPCPTGTTYVWSMNRALGGFNTTTGSVVKFTAGGTTGTTFLFVNATLNGMTVQAPEVSISIHAGGPRARYALNFTSVPATCPLTFNGTSQANASSASFLVGNYTASAPPCTGYFFSEWRWQIGSQGAVSTQNPFTLDVTANGTLKVVYVAKTAWKDSITFSVNHASCSPLQFNGSFVENGTTAQYLAGTFTADAPPCAGYPSAEWAYQPTGSAIRWNYSAWANITIFANGTVSALYWTSPLPLTVSLAASGASTTAGSSLTLTPTVSGGVSPYTCLWSLNGTNTSSIGCSPTVMTWEHPGTYTYRVWATDADSSVAGSDEEAITVSASGTSVPGTTQLVAFANQTSSSGSTGCEGGHVYAILEFVGNARGGVPPYAFTWGFSGEPQSESGRNASHAFVSTWAGPFTVWLNVTDHSGTMASVEFEAVQGPILTCASSGGGLSLLGLSTTASVLLVVAVVAVAVVALLIVVLRWRKGRQAPPPPPGSLSPSAAWGPPPGQ